LSGGFVSSRWVRCLAACAGCSATYSVGGTVAGLTGTGLVLQNNGGKQAQHQRERLLHV